MPLDSLPADYLFTIQADTVSTPAVTIANGPQGTRLIATVSGGSFEGPRLKGRIANTAGGDWVTVCPDGSFRLDVRLTLETEDGALILMTYGGIGLVRDGQVNLRTAPVFQTGDERYAWLNSIQAVGFGTTNAGGVQYEIYGLR